MPLYPVELVTATDNRPRLLLDEFLVAHGGHDLGPDLEAESNDGAIIVDLSEEDAIVLGQEPFVQAIDIHHENPPQHNVGNPQDCDYIFH